MARKEICSFDLLASVTTEVSRANPFLFIILCVEPFNDSSEER
jgi:hypothetical protein